MATLKLLHTSAMVGGRRSRINLSILSLSSDPREYCISTKDFVLDEEGKLKGLNTGTYQRSFLCLQ